MPNRTVHFLTSALVGAAIIGTPLAAEAGGVPHMGTYGGGMSHVPPVSTCGPVGQPGRPPMGGNNIRIYKPVTVTKNIDVTNNIDNSKNISINKSIVINKGGDNISVNAQASAVASASASANAFATGGAGASAVVMGGGGWAPEAPAAFVGGDLGTLAVETRAQCTIQQATVVKTIHAVCLSADAHEFPASHMLGDSWINSGYEGEVVRCIPGSHLKIMIGKVVQSSEGLAAGFSGAQVLECSTHEALRHYKDGLLTCAPAVPVVDCTERTNLRKYGTADLFFSYRAEVCLETQEEYSAVSAVDKPYKGMQSRAR